MLATAAGAPLRAMASLAAIWILVRVIAWQSPSDRAWRPVHPIIGNTAHHEVNRKRPRLAVLPLMIQKDNRPDGSAERRYLSEYIAARGAGASPIAEQPASLVPGLIWPDSEDVRDFFLQASLTRSHAVSGNRARTIPRFPSPPVLLHDNRLVGYFWIYARQGSSAREGVPGKGGSSQSNGQYGGSQAGAILSYRLLDRSVPEISLYGRLSAALAPWSEQEIALGARIRPVRDLPVAMHAEHRIDANSGADSGTAFYVTGGTGPDQIMERFTLETYAQAGYVLGKNETYFFDGSATLQRSIMELDGKKLSVGAGVWAGGQRNITRLDIGPRVSFDLPVGTVLTRIAVDGRVRIAGGAQPGSGAALTVSTGF